DSVLPNKSIRVLKVNRLARRADREKSLDCDARYCRQTRGRHHSYIRSRNCAGAAQEAVKAHESKAGNINQIRIEDMGIGQNEHIVPLPFVRSKARYSGRER